MKKIFLIFFCVFFTITYAQQLPGKLILIPDIQAYKTLKCDLHMHTVFSDGDVWPTVRVEEAWQDGLDVIAITDHIEYQPHKSDLNPDLSLSYKLAESAAARAGIILIKSLEITRNMPPGHFNALFVKDVDSLKKEDPVSVLKAAKDQGAFVFWNHPGWDRQAPNGIKWYVEHTEILNKGLFQGIEVANDNDFYPEAVGWCLEKNLTILGNSDMHNPLGTFLQANEISHRPMTLLFVKERTAEAVKDALVNRRSAVWFKDLLIGSEVYLEPIFQNSVRTAIAFRDSKTLLIKLTNTSDIEINLKMKAGDRIYKMKPRSSLIVTINPELKIMEVEIQNFIVGKDTFLSTTINIPK